MNYIANTRKKRREKRNKIFIGIVIAIAIIVSIYLLSILNISYVSVISSKILSGVDSFFSSIGGVLTEGTSYFGNTKKLNEKITYLEKELSDKDYSLQKMKILETENTDLKTILKIEEEYSHFKRINAKIINRSYDNWNETFVINKGLNDGIKLKQTVIAEQGLVGYISDVTDKASTVTTILDPSTSVSIKISSINALALIKGDFALKEKKQIRLVNVPIDTELSIGETIYTSGIGEVYKKGIPVGTIKEVINKKNDIDRYGVIETFVKMDSIDLVAVIVD